MKENISKEVKELIVKYEQMNATDLLGTTATILSHWNLGLLNEKNRIDIDECYEKGEVVFLPSDVNFNGIFDLASLLVLKKAQLENKDVELNGIDIERYVERNKSIDISLSMFYKLSLYDKIDFIINIIYDLQEKLNLDKEGFDIYALIKNLLDYQKIFLKQSFKD